MMETHLLGKVHFVFSKLLAIDEVIVCKLIKQRLDVGFTDALGHRWRNDDMTMCLSVYGESVGGRKGSSKDSSSSSSSNSSSSISSKTSTMADKDKGQKNAECRKGAEHHQIP